MAIFRAPKISKQDRSQLVLSTSEIVYDIDEDLFYGGDGETIGGFEVGKKSSLKVKTESFSLSREDIDKKEVVLSTKPSNYGDVIFFPEGGISQRNGVDFTVSLNTVTWEGLGLDGFLEVDDIVQITYYYY